MAKQHLLLKLPGIEGEAQTEGYEKQIALDSFTWSFRRGTGKVESLGITCNKKMDKASPKLFKAVTTGQPFEKATLTALKAGGTTTVPYIKLEFEKLLLTSLDEGGNGDGDEAGESLTFQFGKVTVTYHEQKDDGTKGEPVLASYDFAKSVAPK